MSALDQRAEWLLAAVKAWHAAHPQESFHAQPRSCRHGGQDNHSYQLTPAGHAVLNRSSRRSG